MDIETDNANHDQSSQSPISPDEEQIELEPDVLGGVVVFGVLGYDPEGGEASVFYNNALQSENGLMQADVLQDVIGNLGKKYQAALEKFHEELDRHESDRNGQSPPT